MPELGRKYTCYSCHTKFYDLGKPEPLCPKCGADQRDADDAPVYTAPRRSRVVEEPPEEDEVSTPSPQSSESSDDDEGQSYEEPSEERDDGDDDEEEEY
jgi:uncharacterized protein (TIGR02300 family)